MSHSRRGGGSDSQEEVPELLGLLEVGCVCGVLEPHQLLARRLQRVDVALSRFAGGHLVLAALHHDDGHVEAGQTASQVEFGQLC